VSSCLRHGVIPLTAAASISAIKIGQQGNAHDIVIESMLASSMKSGNVDVYSTPSLIALIEAAAVNCITPCLKQEDTSVGVVVNVSHLAATPLGMKVRAEAIVEKVEGRKVYFKVTAFDEKEKIGEGTHERFILNKERFQKKANDKKSQ